MKEYKTKAATVVLRPDGIVEYINNKDWDEPETMELAMEIMGMAKKLIDGQPRGFLVEVPAVYTPKEILKYYQQVEIDDVGRALILNSFATKVMGNLFIKLSKGKTNEAGRLVPTKLFTNREAAIEWLLKEIAKHKN
jgi:hypothetical protein